MAKKDETETAITEQKYKKREFVRKAEGTEKDILTVILDGKKLYSEAEVQGLFAEYLKRKVN